MRGPPACRPLGDHAGFGVVSPKPLRGEGGRCEALQTAAPVADKRSVVIYFFHKNDRYVQCEIAQTHVPDTFAIVVTEADGTVRSHFVEGSLETQRRWSQLESDLKAAGWHGPYGRE